MKKDKKFNQAKQAKSEGYLNALLRYQGQVMTRKEYLAIKIKEGFLPSAEEVIDFSKIEQAKKELEYISKKWILNPSDKNMGSNANLPEVKKGYDLIEKIKDNAFKKRVYYLRNGDFIVDITKTDYEFLTNKEEA